MKKFSFDATPWECFKHLLIVGLLGFASAFTLYLMLPWVLVYHYVWYYDHVTYDGKKMKYTATGLEMFKELFVNFLLTAITFGIYVFWTYPKIEKFNWRHIEVALENPVIDVDFSEN